MCTGGPRARQHDVLLRASSYDSEITRMTKQCSRPCVVCDLHPNCYDESDDESLHESLDESEVNDEEQVIISKLGTFDKQGFTVTVMPSSSTDTQLDVKRPVMSSHCLLLLNCS